MLALGVGASASGASFPPVPGATYTGTFTDKLGAIGHITLTVSSDGTLVSSYLINVHGKDENGDGCYVTAQGGQGSPISNDTFESSDAYFNLQGAFAGAQSASGSFEIDNAAVGGSAGCSTGTIGWTATTTSPPVTTTTSPPVTATTGSPGAGTTISTPSGGGSSPSSSVRDEVAVRISLHRASAKMLIGTVKSSDRRCYRDRVVYLWRRAKRLGSAHSSSKGRFSFRVTRSLKNQPVRATVLAARTSTLACQASSSVFIGA